MIGFDLSDEQKQLQQLAHDFADNEIRPVAAHHDETGDFPGEVIKKAHAVGLTNTHIPEKWWKGHMAGMPSTPCATLVEQ